jgi:peptide chain release factor subunit 1
MERVRELAGERHRPVVTTCYVDVDGARNPRPVDRERHMANLRRELERRLEDEHGRGGLPHDYRTSVRSDLERMERYVSEELDRGGTRGLALFACSAEDFFEAVALPFAVHDEAALDTRPRLRQLELGLAEQRTWGVVLVDRQRLRLWVADATGLHSLGDRTEHVGSRQEQGGYAGPRIQRHADELARRNFEEFAAAVAYAFHDVDVDGLLVGATGDDLVAFLDELDRGVAERVAAHITVGTNAPDDEVRAAVARAAELLTEQRREEVLRRLEAALDGAEPAAAGLNAVVDALLEKRVEVVVVEDGYTASGFRCTSCDMLALEGGACPSCGAGMEDVDDMVDEVVTRALRENAAVLCAAPDRLRRFGHIAAQLRW